MSLSYGREDTMETYIDRIYSIMRTNKISKTPEEREAICKLATTVAVATGFMRDAHTYLGEYSRLVDKLMSMDRRILSLMPTETLGELNRLMAVTEAWQVHAEAEIFAEGQSGFGEKPEAMANEDLSEIIGIALSRDQELAAVGTDDAEPAQKNDNVVSLFQKK